MQKTMCFIVDVCQLGENKSNDSRGNIESIFSNLIRRIIHRTCRARLQAKEMDSSCPTFNCGLLLGGQPPLQPRHDIQQPYGGLLLGEVLKCYFKFILSLNDYCHDTVIWGFTVKFQFLLPLHCY